MKADEDDNHIDVFENNLHDKPHAHNAQHNKKNNATANINNWTSVNYKAKKYWRKKDATNDMATANVVDEEPNVSTNPFEALANEQVENGNIDAVVHDVHTNTNVQANIQEVGQITEGNNQGVGRNSDNADKAHVTTNLVADVNTSPEAQVNNSQIIADHSSEHTNPDVDMENLVGNIFDDTPVNGANSAKGDLGKSSTTMSPVASKSPVATKSSAPESSSSQPLKASPYGNLKPPANFQLPPPNVTGSGLTFPIVNPALLSTAVPRNSLPSFQVKNNKLKGKFWADDDLDEGYDYGPEDVMPLTSKMKTSRRHTRKNPMYDPSLN